MVDDLVESMGLSRRESRELLRAMFEEIGNALERGETVSLSGFGVFKVRDKNWRMARNPMLGTPAEVKARRVVTFRATGKLANRVDESLGGSNVRADIPIRDDGYNCVESGGRKWRDARGHEDGAPV